MQMGAACSRSRKGKTTMFGLAGGKCSHWAGKIVSRSELATASNVIMAERVWRTTLGGGSFALSKTSSKSASSRLSEKLGRTHRASRRSESEVAFARGCPSRAMTLRRFSNNVSTRNDRVVDSAWKGPTKKSTSPAKISASDRKSTRLKYSH